MKVDVIGDIHSCYAEVCDLLEQLGYEYKNFRYIHQDGRIPIFLGDITDRGPASIQTIELVYRMVIEQKMAKYIPGNHCNKLYRYFLGNHVKIKNGLETTIEEYTFLNQQKQKEIKDKFLSLYEQAPLYLQLPVIQAVIAHAGIKESYIGRFDKQVKSFVLYGDTTGEIDETGRPIRKDWAQDYKGDQWIIYGHTPVLEPRIIHKTINIDTGCVFGNMLTSFSLPEEKIVSIPSKQTFQRERFSYVDE